MRLAVFEDSVYRRDADGLSAQLAFSTFLWALADRTGRLVVLGRLDPEPGRAAHPVQPSADAVFVPLPHYGSLLDLAGLARALPGAARAFWRALGEVDALWVNGPSPVAVLAAVLGVLRRRRVVLGVRQDTMEYARRRYPGRRGPVLAFRALDLAWRALARVLPVTAVGDELAASYPRARRRLAYRASLVRADELSGPEVEAARGGTPVTVLSVGRLDEEKNPLLLADVAARLGPGYRLQVVGEGSLADALRARVAELGVADRVELLGYVPLGAPLHALYRAADLLLHVSWTEGVPQVVLEAYAARLPVVGTDVGGVGALVEGIGLLVPPGDADAAADAVRRFAEDPALRARAAAAGVERVAEHTLEAEAQRVLDFIAAP